MVLLRSLEVRSLVVVLLLMTLAAPVLPQASASKPNLLTLGAATPALSAVSASSPNSLSPASTYTSSDWLSWAGTAWNYYAPGVGVNSVTGLHQASLTFNCFADWDLGSYIYATLFARKLGLIGDGGAWQFDDRIGRILSFLLNRPLIGDVPYNAYAWDSGAVCPGHSYASDGADQGRLLAALYALKTYRPSYASQVNAIFNRSKSYYNTVYYQLGFEYYSYQIAEGYAAFGYDESNIFNGIDNYNGLYTIPQVYGQNLPRVYTVAEPLDHVLLESDTLYHQPSSSFVDFANRVKLAQEGRYTSTNPHLLTAWSEGGYAPNPGHTDPYYMYEDVLDNDGVTPWVMKLGSTYYDPSVDPPLVYTKVAFSYLALYGENTYTLALVNAVKNLVSPCTFGFSLCGFGEGAYEDGSSAYSRFNGNFFYTDKTNEFVLAAAYRALNPLPPCPAPSPETPGTSFFHPYTDFWFSRYDMVNAGWDAIHFVNVGSGTATIQITIGNPAVLSDSLTLAAGGATYKTYPGVQGGPVHVTSDQPIWVTQRILGWTAMQEIYGMPGNVASKYIIGTWYDLVYADSDDIYIINPDPSQTASVGVCVAGLLRGTYTVGPKGEFVTNFPEIIGGPLRFVSNIPVFASQRVIGYGDFAEVIGLPAWYTFTETWFNWYDAHYADLDNVHMLNPGTSAATVSIYIGGTLRASLNLSPGGADYRAFSGLIGGPVKIVSTQPIWVTQRIIGWGGWKEVFGVPTTLANTQWYMTWYDMQNAQWDAIHVINPGATGATVQIYVAGVLRDTITVGAGQAAYVTYPGLIGGPVRIVSTVPIMSSQRVLGWGSFEETVAASIS